MGTEHVYNQGYAQGTITGGNIQTYSVQAGTPYFPNVKTPVIFIEQAEGSKALEFSRDLAQILQIHTDIKGLVIGRFPTENILKTIPVIYHVDFGHTQPIFTFPLGGEVEIDTSKMQISIIKG